MLPYYDHLVTAMIQCPFLSGYFSLQRHSEWNCCKLSS